MRLSWVPLVLGVVVLVGAAVFPVALFMPMMAVAREMRAGQPAAQPAAMAYWLTRAPWAGIVLSLLAIVSGIGNLRRCTQPIWPSIAGIIAGTVCTLTWGYFLLATQSIGQAWPYGQ